VNLPADVAGEVALGQRVQLGLAALLVVAAVAPVAHEDVVGGVQTHAAPLALVALPLELTGLDVLDEFGAVLEAVGVGLGAAVRAAKEPACLGS
jgi:hypothetical protein